MRVFLSHNSKDKAFARALARRLRAHGADVWFDEWEIAPGQSILERLESGLETSDAFTVLWSQNARQSPWVGAELRAYLRRRIDNATLRVIPIQLDDSPLPVLLRDYCGFCSGDRHGLSPDRIALAILEATPGFRLETKQLQVHLHILRVDGSLARLEKVHKISCIAGPVDKFIDGFGTAIEGGQVTDFSFKPGRRGDKWIDRDLLRIEHIFPRPLRTGQSLVRKVTSMYRNTYIVSPGYHIQKQYYPTERLSMATVFPKSRPPRKWWAEEVGGDRRRSLPVRRTTLADKPAIEVVIRHPLLLVDYVLNWEW